MEIALSMAFVIIFVISFNSMLAVFPPRRDLDEKSKWQQVFVVSCQRWGAWNAAVALAWVLVEMAKAILHLEGSITAISIITVAIGIVKLIIDARKAAKSFDEE